MVNEKVSDLRRLNGQIIYALTIIAFVLKKRVNEIGSKAVRISTNYLSYKGFRSDDNPY